MLGGKRVHMTNNSIPQGLAAHKACDFFQCRNIYKWTSYYKIQKYLPNLLLQLVKEAQIYTVHCRKYLLYTVFQVTVLCSFKSASGFQGEF